MSSAGLNLIAIIATNGVIAGCSNPAEPEPKSAGAAIVAGVRLREEVGIVYDQLGSDADEPRLGWTRIAGRRSETLRLMLVVLLAVSVSCSSNNELNNHATDDATADMSTSDIRDEDVEPDVGDDAEPDVALSNPVSCDPIAQDCVETVNSQCAFVHIPEDEVATYACRAPLGTVGQGEPCERLDDVVGEDTCGPGLFCAFWGLPASEPQARQCLAFCNPDAPCEPGFSCLTLDNGTSGVCAPQCDPADDQCPDGTKCGSYFGAEILPGLMQDPFVWICDFDSGAPLDTACSSSFDCARGQICAGPGPDQRTCRQFCDLGDCTGTESCLPTSSRGGFCADFDWSCVGMTPAPDPVQAEATVQVLVHNGFEFLNAGPIEGATVKACAADDPACAAPIDTATTGLDGAASLTVPTVAPGFDGYFEVSADGSSTTLVHPGSPITENTSVTADLMPANLSLIWADLEPSSTRGFLLTYVYPCTTTDGPFPLGAGVELTTDLADGMSITRYLSSDVFNSDLSRSSFMGIVGTRDHPAGDATVTVTNADDVTVYEGTATVRANAVTLVHARAR